MEIIQATAENLEVLTPLFNGYRVFYEQKTDNKVARAFLKDRFKKDDSIIFLAMDKDGKGQGFTQLYPSFSSVSLQRTYILNDLFVAPQARKQGIGEALMERAKQFARKEGSKGLTLETGIDNPAQKLYERLGWKKDEDVNHYTWKT